MTPGGSYRVLRRNRFGQEPHNLTQAPGDARIAELRTNRPAWEPAPLRAARQRQPISASRLPTANDSARGARETPSHRPPPPQSSRASPRGRPSGRGGSQGGTKRRSRGTRGRHYAGSGLRRGAEQGPAARDSARTGEAKAKPPRGRWRRARRGWRAEAARGQAGAAYLRESWRSSPSCPLEHTQTELALPGTSARRRRPPADGGVARSTCALLNARRTMARRPTAT